MAYIMKLETCLLVAEAHRDLVVSFQRSRSTKSNTSAIKNLLLFMAGWFLVEKCAA